ncbi:MAG: hypothetical protein JOY73_06910 [Actinobacteria bacterium]|nr:hypothetical protein [Actinomycetota bacterium]
MFVLLCSSAAGASGAFAGAGRAKAAVARRAAALRYLDRQLQAAERQTWYWERLTGTPRTQTAGRTLASIAVRDLSRTVKRWKRRELAAHEKAQHPPHMADWMCIHHWEGAWNDRGGLYWGGLQMSISFQERYGGWIYKRRGTADHWTPLEQIWTAENALKTRGFWPWPNTARMCGLI